MVVGACQIFRFSDKIPGFSKKNRALTKFLYEILHYLTSNSKLSKKSVHVSQFYINHVSHLNVWLVSYQGPLVLELRMQDFLSFNITETICGIKLLFFNVVRFSWNLQFAHVIFFGLVKHVLSALK